MQHNQTEFCAVAEEKIEQRQMRLKKQMIIVLVIQCNQTVNFALWPKKKSSNDS